MKNSKHVYYGPEYEEEKTPKKTISERRNSRKQKESATPIEESSNQESGSSTDEKAKPIRFAKRPIIDPIVKKNSNSDLEKFYSVVQGPIYEGNIDSSLVKTRLSKGELSHVRLIEDIVEVYNYLKMQPGDSYILYRNIRFNTHVELIKFLKACIYGQSNKNVTFSQAVASFTNSIVNGILSDRCVTYPVSCDSEDILTMTVYNELNEFLFDILKSYKIDHKEVVDGTQVKTKGYVRKKKKEEVKGEDAFLSGAEVISGD